MRYVCVQPVLDNASVSFFAQNLPSTIPGLPAFPSNISNQRFFDAADMDEPADFPDFHRFSCPSLV